MTTLYLSYETEEHCVRDPYPDDDWDQGDYTGDYHVTSVHLTPGMRDAYETAEPFTEGDTVHVLYVAYDSGSTFGTTGGYGEIIAVSKDYDAISQAERWLDWQLANSYNTRSRHKPTEPPFPASLTKPSYLGCTGYFEHNQRVRTTTLTVKP